MSFLVKQIKCEQQKCEAANQNCTYKLSCGIDVRQAITGKKDIVIILYHIVIFFFRIFLEGYGV
jgi:G:T-mismatch repair DNA endonuclease (very short patch repair protein)